MGVGMKTLQQLELLLAVHDEIESELCRLLEFRPKIDTFEQHYRSEDPGVTKLTRLLEPGNRESIGRGERPGHGHDAVTVGIRFDYGHHTRLGRCLSYHAEIVDQRRRVDRGAAEGSH
jgi:hypothetical protein